MKKMTLSGCGTALVTPFREGEVDYPAYRALTERQVGAGVDFLVPLGSTAETPCLEDEEKLKLLEITREVAGPLPVLAGCGTNSLKATLRNVRRMEPCGPDAFLVVVPYYNKPTQEGMYRYFKAVAESTDKAVIIYNVPGRTGANIRPDTVLRLAEIPNITGIKEASGDVAQILEIVSHRPEGFAVLSGNDDQTLVLMAGGADGVISVASNIAPKLVAELAHAAQAADFRAAASLNRTLVPLYKACFIESNPIPAKAALRLMGLCTDEMRLPLTTATPATAEIMKRTLADIAVI